MGRTYSYSGNVRQNRNMVQRILKPIALIGLLVVIAGCGTVFPPPEKAEYTRIVLLEEGTGTWCVNCPRAAASIEKLLKNHDGELIVLAHHALGNDPYATKETETRTSKLGMKSFPSIVFDGTEQAANDNFSTLEARLKQRRDLGSWVKIDFKANFSTNDTITYTVTFTASEKMPDPIKANIRIALLEPHVDFINEIWDGLSHVVRRIPEPKSADALTLNAGDAEQRTLPFYADESFADTLIMVIWLEDTKGTKVYNTAYTKVIRNNNAPPDDFNVIIQTDTLRTVNLPGDNAIFNFQLKNNTSKDEVLTVDIAKKGSTLPESWTWQFCVGTVCLDPKTPGLADVPAHDTKEVHLTVATGVEGSEGVFAMSVSDENKKELLRQNFVVKVKK